MKHLQVALEDNLKDVQEQDENKEPVVMMTGPLSSIYTRALNLAYAKDPNGPTETTLESQAIDAAMANAQSQRDQVEDGDVIELPYFYNPSTSKEEERAEVTKVLNQIGRKDVEFVFYQDETIPEAMAGQVNANLQGGRMLAIESIQIRVRVRRDNSR